MTPGNVWERFVIIFFFASKLHWNWRGRTNDMYFFLFIAVWLSQMKLLTFCLTVHVQSEKCCDSVHTNRSRRSTNSYIPICCSPWIINTHIHIKPWARTTTLISVCRLQPKFYFAVVGFALFLFDFFFIDRMTKIDWSQTRPRCSTGSTLATKATTRKDSAQRME